jgi:hypothetical protein
MHPRPYGPPGRQFATSKARSVVASVSGVPLGDPLLGVVERVWNSIGGGVCIFVLGWRSVAGPFCFFSYAFFLWCMRVR